MAEAAYNLEHFAPVKKTEKPKIKVVKRKRTQRQTHLLKMMRTMLTVMLVVLLVFGVLYTQTTLTELQKEITAQEGQLRELVSMSDYLNNELENLSNVKYIEERAQQLGLQKVDKQWITYVHINGDSEIQIQENGWQEVFENTKNGLLSIWDYVSP